jgi:hypothetical protein
MPTTHRQWVLSTLNYADVIRTNRGKRILFSTAGVGRTLGLVASASRLLWITPVHPLAYSERRKLTMSWRCDEARALKFAITVLASEPQFLASVSGCNSLPFPSKTSRISKFAQTRPRLKCSCTASKISDVRPSCIKNKRWPTPHNGAVRNISGPADPCTIPSARFEPI